VTRRVLGAATVALAFAAVTGVALEGGEVVVLRTVDAAGHLRETRTWIADADGAAWIEAANPDRPFLHDVAASPAVELHRAGRWRPCRAEVHVGPEGHARIRSLLRARYGWADRWIALLADTSNSAAVRLDCPP
jgi:hypothetical protein